MEGKEGWVGRRGKEGWVGRGEVRKGDAENKTMYSYIIARFGCGCCQ